MHINWKYEFISVGCVPPARYRIGGLCPRGLCLGRSLFRGLCLGVSVWGVCMGVSVWGICPEDGVSAQGVSLSGGFSLTETPSPPCEQNHRQL